jgi:rubredoxin
MNSWKCKSCGYSMKADLPPNDCPSCKKTCEFLDITCYTPDCKYVEVDDRIGTQKESE